ncbi:MAG: protein PilO [Deltaproteobacteria bacterium]|nr:MAG: protein PilO [Deltaproteobacteria bacterium]
MAENYLESQGRFELFSQRLSELTNVQKAGILFFTIFVVAGLYTWFFYLPQKEKIEFLESEDQRLVTQVSVARAKAANLGKVRREFENRKEEFFIVMRALPETKEIPGILSAISSSAKDSDLEISKISPGKEVDKGFYAEIPVNMRIKGGFHETAIFFDRISRFGRIVNIDSANMTMGKDNSIKTECKALTYRFLKKEENKKKKK